MGTFSNKIVAEFTPPKTWMLEDELAFETNELKDEDIEVLTKIGANIVDTGRDTGRITCRKGMQTDLASSHQPISQTYSVSILVLFYTVYP